MNQAVFKTLNTIAQSIYDKKGFNILVLDVQDICTMTDFFIIAEGTVDRHVQALSRAVMDQLGQQGLKPLHVEGQESGDWIVLDYVDFVVHLFLPDFREKYALEELWNEGKVVDVKIDTGRPEPKLPKKNSLSELRRHD